MKHAREDYNRIQDPEGKIPDDEPVFLLRAQDVSAPFAVEHWAIQNELRGGDPELSALANMQASLMRIWQKQHGSKPADAPEGLYEN